MMLLTQGYGTQARDWHVDECSSPGYSRVYWIESGNVVYEQNDNRVLLEHNTLYIFPSTVPFSIHHSPDNPLCCLWLHFNTFPCLVSSLVSVPMQSGSTLDYLMHILKEQIIDKQIDTPFFKIMVNGFTHYLQQCEIISPAENSMLEVIEYMNENFSDSKLNVNSLSERFGYSPEHFIRIFTQAVKITPYQYLLNIRLNCAQRMLLENISVKKAAAAVGYEDAHTFSRAFQKKYLIAPSLYKNYYSPIA